MQEPGLDWHEWESEMQALVPQIEEAPAEALSELGDLIERILAERGYDISDPVARQGDEREVIAEYLAAREISDLVERGDEAAGPGDVAAAINGFRAVYDFLLNERRTP